MRTVPQTADKDVCTAELEVMLKSIVVVTAVLTLSANDYILSSTPNIIVTMSKSSTYIRSLSRNFTLYLTQVINRLNRLRSRINKESILEERDMQGIFAL